MDLLVEREVLAEGAEDTRLICSGEDGEDPHGLAFPQMEDAEASGISLERLARQCWNRFDLTRERAGG